MSKNLGKEILVLFVVFLHMKIILPIIKVMGFNLMVREAGFNLMVREVTASLKVLTFVSKIMAMSKNLGKEIVFGLIYYLSTYDYFG
jgi:hypothetical protein